MCLTLVKILVILGFFERNLSQAGTPPRVEDKPILLESYLPATMQILAYLTEMLKYDLKPTTTPPYGPTTTSTMRPTPYHRPAIYAPLKLPGPEPYFQSPQKDSYRQYVESLKQHSGPNYFDRYKQVLDTNTDEIKSSRALNFESDNTDNKNVMDGVATYFGRNFIDTLKLVKDVDKDVSNDLDEQSQNFLRKYDDSDFRVELLRQKQVPPTRAYVTLLSLYDMLNKESKRLGLNKYTGYTENILKELADTSTNTSTYQLRLVLKKVIERKDTTKQDVVKKINQLVGDLDDSNSYISVALKYIPPLAFAL